MPLTQSQMIAAVADRAETRRARAVCRRGSRAVLSGDAPAMVGAIAQDAGVPGEAPTLDGQSLPEDPTELRQAVLAAPAVGRISPEGKRAVIDALTDGGRYVGMLGDGVNDVGALKDARLAIAQGSGTQMARSVADLVLVRGDFAVVPAMVAEGRQILRNVQRVARLFLTKTVFTAVLGIVVGIPFATYPLLPRQFTLAATVTIGVPAFVLALAPSTGPWRPEHFLSSVSRFAITAGVPIGLGISAGYLLARYGFDVGLARSRTVATATVVVCGLAVVLQIESECAGRRRRIAVAGLSALMALLFALALLIPFLRRFYELTPPTVASLGAWAIGTALGAGCWRSASVPSNPLARVPETWRSRPRTPDKEWRAITRATDVSRESEIVANPRDRFPLLFEYCHAARMGRSGVCLAGAARAGGAARRSSADIEPSRAGRLRSAGKAPALS